MNAAIRAVTSRATFSGAQVFGLQQGYAGLIAGEISELTARAVGRILHLGATIPGGAQCEELRTDEGAKKSVAQPSRHSIDVLVVIGENGFQTGAHTIAPQTRCNAAAARDLGHAKMTQIFSECTRLIAPRT